MLNSINKLIISNLFSCFHNFFWSNRPKFGRQITGIHFFLPFFTRLFFSPNFHQLFLSDIENLERKKIGEKKDCGAPVVRLSPNPNLNHNPYSQKYFFLFYPPNYPQLFLMIKVCTPFMKILFYLKMNKIGNRKQDWSNWKKYKILQAKYHAN